MAEDIYVLIREGDLPQLYRLSYKGIKAYLKRQQYKGKDGASVIWQGAWSSSTSYNILDMVSYNGQSYISIKLGTNKNPETRTDYWELMAAKGTDGGGMTWQGAWDSGTTYAVNDAVSNDGSSYICILESTNNEPPNATYWELFAEKGEPNTASLPLVITGANIAINNATTTTHGAMSSTDKTKLDGVESGADVTDSVNIGSSIHGSAEKTTLVDNDEFAIIDSEASNVLKRSFFSTIKSILKTFFDGLYAALSHTHNYLVPPGGTTDQVLAKNSNTNGDLKWATVSGGSFDIHALTATTALANADEFPLYDDSASAQRKATWETIWKHLFPVGSIVCFDNTTSDPNTIYGGTWSRVGDGKFPVGYDSGDTDFDTALETGGAKTINLAHTHLVTPPSYAPIGTISSRAVGGGTTDSKLSATQSILPPYIVFCYWRRTA